MTALFQLNQANARIVKKNNSRLYLLSNNNINLPEVNPYLLWAIITIVLIYLIKHW